MKWLTLLGCFLAASPPMKRTQEDGECNLHGHRRSTHLNVIGCCLLQAIKMSLSLSEKSEVSLINQDGRDGDSR